MATLPSIGSASELGVLITTVADTAGITETQAGLEGLGAGAEAATAAGASSLSTFTSNLKSVGTQMTNVGRSLTTFVTLPIVGVAAVSTKMAMDFQQSMEVLHTNANVPQSAIATLSQQILALAPQVGAGPEALAQAMYHVASATPGIFNAANEMNILKAAAEGAAIGQANLDDTTYALTAALSSNITGAKDANQMMATLLATVGAGDMTMQNLNDAIGTGFLGTMQSFGVSIQSVGAALATLGDNGERGAAAATRLRMMVTLMTSPSAAAAKILGDLGLTTGEAATATSAMNEVFAKTGLTTTTLADDLQKPDGINVAIQDIKSHLEAAHLTAGQTDAILAKAFGGGRTDAALLQLLSNVDKTDQKFGQINKDSTSFGANWALQQQQAKQQWAEAWSGIQSDMIRLGVTIMPQVTTAMGDVAKAVTGVTNWFEHLSGGQKQFVIDALGIVAVVGPVLLVFGTLATSISGIITLATTLGPIFAGAAGAIGASGALIIGILAGIAADAYLVVKAFQAVTGAFNAIQQANAASKYDQASESAAHQQLLTLSQTGSPAQQARANTLLGQGYATGTNYAPGGWSMVGENGPEMMYVPRGSQILSNSQSNLTNSSQTTTVSIGQVVLASASAVTEFFQQIDRDTQLQSMGMSPARGIG